MLPSSLGVGYLKPKELHARSQQSAYLQFNREAILIGRCIHIDTSAPTGTSPDEAMVKHLDLAINVYCGDTAKLRMKSPLCNKDKVEASFRSHILRIHGVPFSILPEICAAFFLSNVMVRELLDNQFSEG